MNAEKRQAMIKASECGDGWKDIITSTNAILEIIDPNYEIFQIKEKFGALRYYVTWSQELPSFKRELGYDVINKAEHLSEITCEYCGAPGKGREGNWLKTLCDSCNNK